MKIYKFTIHILLILSILAFFLPIGAKEKETIVSFDGQEILLKNHVNEQFSLSPIDVSFYFTLPIESGKDIVFLRRRSNLLAKDSSKNTAIFFSSKDKINNPNFLLPNTPKHHFLYRISKDPDDDLVLPA